MEFKAEMCDRELYNKDLAPTDEKERTWTSYNYMALWLGMSICIPTYMMAAGLIAGGMNWKQAIFTIFLGNLIVLIPMILNGHPGTKYGINFPVFARSSFGVRGANIPAIMRAIVACGWFGIQTWIGGEAINSLIIKIIPGWSDFSLGIWISFAIFWFMNMWIVWHGMEMVKKFEGISSPILIVSSLVLLGWAIYSAHGLGPIVAQPSKFKTFGEFFAFFIPSLTGVIGFWATLSLNIPDFTRFSKNQREQIVGQSIGLPASMVFFSLVGMFTASATMIVFGEAIWDPVVLISKFNNPLVAIIGVIVVSIVTLTTNIAANVVSPAYDFTNLFPKWVDFKRGATITGIIGIIMMPWKLLADYSTYINNWLVGYSAFLGPIAGILITDYYLVRKCDLAVHDLYRLNGRYSFSNGYNWKAVGSLVFGIVLGLIGKVVPSLAVLYNYAWFVGFFASSILYYVLMKYSLDVGSYTTAETSND
ncbi:NCS1 family nucleobase:cation symporter-1 [Caldanaerobius polysaccharolyticus]|uniref:NCS1 family nucleobase:cation symporter-1 n=1 Tax=Caldanaerobius polysaccharolyticus TaxID=44256 RepID=UPI00068E990F|nr:NCS1 family nucleobase:cation symporter-1 [Caldanaerobius polysaccharolyticus]